MNYQENEREISLRAMLFAVVRQWKRMISFGLLFALLAGGFMGLRRWQQLRDPAQAAAAAEAYKAAMEEYEQTKAVLEENRDKLQASLIRWQDYLSVSVLMNMDPWNYYSAKANYYIVPLEEQLPGEEESGKGQVVAAAYRDILWDSAFLSELAEKYGLELRCLKELITLEHTKEGILKVSVRHTNPVTAERMLEDLLLRIDEEYENITAAVLPHRVEQILYAVGPDMDEELALQQQAAQDALKAASDSAVAAEDALNALKEPKLTVIGGDSALTAAVKYGIVGAVVGVFLAAVLGCIGFIFGDKVTSAAELRLRYDAEVLGAVCTGKKSKLDAWMRRLEGRQISSAAAVAVHAANRVKMPGDLLLVGADGGEGLAEAIAARTGRGVVCGSSLLEDEALASRICGCGGVILLVKCGASTYSQVGRELECAVRSGAPVLGCIVEEN